MVYNPEIHHRRSIRLKEFDYSQTGAYFLTICTYNRLDIFGKIKNNKMILNEYGEIVKNEWLKTPEIRSEIGLDEYVIMPNHFHGIVWINRRGDRPVAPTSESGLGQKSVGALIAGFKSAITKQINLLRKLPGIPVWQRNYYEQVIRDDRDLFNIRQYTRNNPQNWESDEENLIVGGPDGLNNASILSGEEHSYRKRKTLD